MTKISTINLGKNGPLVAKLGLGCMRMSPVWGGPANDESESIATIQSALDSGINFLNTGDFMVPVTMNCWWAKPSKGEGTMLYQCQVRRNFPQQSVAGLDLRPIAIKNFINYSLVRLGIDTIDLYQPCRMDNSVRRRCNRNRCRPDQRRKGPLSGRF